MKKFLLLLVLLAPLVVQSCYYDSEESLYPTLSTTCDTVNITFSKNIVPIMSSNCYGCHSNANAPAFGNSISLEDYTDVVDAYDKLYASITHQSSKPMPKNSAQLSSCALRQFAIWRQNGFPQ